MYCVKCGAQNPDTGKFCKKCGTPLQIKQEMPKKPEIKPEPVKKKKTEAFKIGAGVALVAVLLVTILWRNQICFQVLRTVHYYEKAAVFMEKIPEEKLEKSVRRMITDYNQAVALYRKYEGTYLDELSQLIKNRKDELWEEACKNFLQNEKQLVENTELRIEKEDVHWEEGLYQIENPDSEKYTGVLHAMTSDLNADGANELLTVELFSKEITEKENALYADVYLYRLRDDGSFEAYELEDPSGYAFSSIAVTDLWETTSEVLFNRYLYVDILYGSVHGKPHIVVLSHEIGKYKIECQVSIYSINDNDTFCRKEGYLFAVNHMAELEEAIISEEGKEVVQAESKDEACDLGNQILDTVERYGILFNTETSHWEWQWDERFEKISSICVNVDDLRDELSGYQLSLEGDLGKMNIAKPVEQLTQESALQEPEVQAEAAEPEAEAQAYERMYDVSVYADYMQQLDNCLGDCYFENVEDIQDLAFLFEFFYTQEYGWEDSGERFYNPATQRLEIPGHEYRRILMKYLDFQELNLAKYLSTDNRNESCYYDVSTDIVSDPYIGGFGGEHDGWSEIEFTVLEPGVVQARAVYNMEGEFHPNDGTIPEIQMVVREEADGVLKLISYTGNRR